MGKIRDRKAKGEDRVGRDRCSHVRKRSDWAGSLTDKLVPFLTILMSLGADFFFPDI